MSSLIQLKLTSVDLYLIHHPRLTNGDPPAPWREFERAKKEGLVMVSTNCPALLYLDPILTQSRCI